MKRTDKLLLGKGSDKKSITYLNMKYKSIKVLKSNMEENQDDLGYSDKVSDTPRLRSMK